MVTGDGLLAHLDRDIQQMRARLSEAMGQADEAAAYEVRVRDVQLEKYRVLTDIRVDFLQTENGERARLDRAHTEASALLDQHASFVKVEEARLMQASENIRVLEEERVAAASAHREATDAYDARVNEIEAGLAETVAYQALVQAHNEAQAIVSRAVKKHELSLEDRREKGAPYDGDPLFSYLWKRGFRTPQYRAMPLIRTLDNWVAGLCRYEQAYLNYQRLTELPERLAEHVGDVEQKAAAAEAALDKAEVTALAEGGAKLLQEKADEQAARLSAIDVKIEDAEKIHRELTVEHEKSLRAETGPALKARQIIEAALREASLPSLRVMAAETIALEDDHLVDELVQLRADESIVECEVRAAGHRLATLRADLAEMEACRRRIKDARLDSPYVTYQAATADDVLRALERGAIKGNEAFDRLRRAARRSGSASTGFGGARRTRTMGVPDILGDVMWEVAKEAMRQGQGGSWGGHTPTRRSSSSRPTVRIPRSSGGSRRGGGGFKTGGGF